MKKLLKSLILPVFLIVPTMTVVACGTTSQQLSPDDILNSAEGAMQSHMFTKEELNLQNIPQDGNTYNSIGSSARNYIKNYYSELIKEGNNNWNYPTVELVNLTSATDEVFVNKYGPNVEARISLVTHLKYKNHERNNQTVTVRISNNAASGEEKVNAIKDYLITELKKDITFSVNTLLPDVLIPDDNRGNINNIYGKIGADLRNTLLQATTDTDPFPIIDIDKTEEVNITVSSAIDSTSAIYELDTQNLSGGTDTVTGKFENLNLTISYREKDQTYYASIDLVNDNINSLKVAQSFTSVQNQLQSILLQNYVFGVDQLKGGALPTVGKTLKDYDGYDPTNPGSRGVFLTNVVTEMFNNIAVIYPTAKMDPNWNIDSNNKTLILINNTAATNFRLVNSSDTHHGYFIVNVSFDFLISADLSIHASADKIQLNLNDLPAF